MNPRTFFEKVLLSNEVELKRIKKLSLLLSMLRLAVFLMMAASIYFFLENTAVIAGSLIVGITAFLLLVSKYTDVKNKKLYHQKLKEINEKELDALDGNFSEFEAGTEFLSDTHHYNQDIDLFGEGSFFQRINRTGTLEGKSRLADFLNSNDVSGIEEKQASIKEIASYHDWRQNYQVLAALIDSEVKSTQVVNWVKNYIPTIPNHFRITSLIYSLLSVTAIALYGVGFIDGIWVGAWLFVGLNITGIYIKRVSALSNQIGKAKSVLSQYSKLILAVENQQFESPNLTSLKQKLETEGEKASAVLQQLTKEISSLDQRNNLIFAMIGNGFLLWDLRFANRIENWIKEFDASIENWFEVVEEFDALNSLGNMVFTHPEYIFPKISSDKHVVLNGKDLGHPLLDAGKRVDNDIKVDKGSFFIITGANMAGKSTFLRTVALNLVMANCGLPVCAKEFDYKPIKLISSMRTSDSLKDDESYFFSELKRLKFIVDELESDQYFVILDEILKGTNSKDKAEGSKKFVARLVSSGSTGLIATHDLSLCSLSDEFDQVQNHYFDAEIINDELHFDYKFKDGVCKNMNASFLLKKMQIV